LSIGRKKDSEILIWLMFITSIQRTGKGYTMPFGLACLGPANPESLIALAEHYEALAAKLREMAKTELQHK